MVNELKLIIYLLSALNTCLVPLAGFLIRTYFTTKHSLKRDNERLNNYKALIDSHENRLDCFEKNQDALTYRISQQEKAHNSISKGVTLLEEDLHSLRIELEKRISRTESKINRKLINIEKILIKIDERMNTRSAGTLFDNTQNSENEDD